MTNRKSEYYFAYGSNLNLTHMKGRCPNAKFMGKFTLHNWELVFRGVADIQPAKNKKVVGGLFKITPKCEKSLDGYEGFPFLYIKGYMQSEIDGKNVEVMTYIMREQDCIKPPSDFYFATIKQGYRDCGINIRQLNTAEKNSYDERFGIPRGGFSWGIPRPKQPIVDDLFGDLDQTYYDDTKPYGRK